MDSSFLKEDVTLLLKDISGLVEPLSTEEREKKIQSGTHYSEMLPLEYSPTQDYIKIYENSLKIFGQSTADAIARVSDKIAQIKGKKVVIVSLARAGTPLGVLICRYIRKKYRFECPHYSVSIIRGRGIDKNAMNYILGKHHAASIQFVDGWIGKGAIFNELKKELSTFNGVQDSLAVLADPAGLTELCGTHDDILIPSSCLNCTICGLISRTFLREDIIGKNEFHGAVYYSNLKEEDRTYEFINFIEEKFNYQIEPENRSQNFCGINDVHYLAEKYNISDVNYIKPGIGETTRVLLRRIPWKVVIDERYIDSKELNHIKQLSIEKNVAIEYVHLNNYKCCGLIKQLSDI